LIYPNNLLVGFQGRNTELVDKLYPSSRHCIVKGGRSDFWLFCPIYCISAAVTFSKAAFAVIHPNNLLVGSRGIEIGLVEETNPDFQDCIFIKGESECRPPFLALCTYSAVAVSKAAFASIYTNNPLVESARLNIGSVEELDLVHCHCILTKGWDECSLSDLLNLVYE